MARGGLGEKKQNGFQINIFLIVCNFNDHKKYYLSNTTLSI